MDLLISGCINLKENNAFIESNIIISLFYFFYVLSLFHYDGPWLQHVVSLVLANKQELIVAACGI